MTTETIAAIASGLTHAGIGIIRISGPDALQVGDRVVTLKNGKAIAAVPTHTVHYGLAHEGEEVLDEILAVVMRAPHSFTGEDVVELQCHGGPLIMRRLLDAVLHQGARLAEPGEFTRRAFLNGRMDLSQAEAVMDLIHSQNEFARKASIEQLQGQGHIHATDVDPAESAKTKKRLADQGFGEDMLTIHLQNFCTIDEIAKEVGGFDFVLADLGVSSMQIDNPKRGFSFKVDGPLDLRLNQEKGISAAERLDNISEEELAGMLYENSDEPYCEELAKAITTEIRKGNRIDTTTKLRNVIEKTLDFLPNNKEKKDIIKKTCQRTFQALRIDVNNEFEVLYEFMEKLPGALKPGGRVAILTFHSGEDKLVKKALKAGYKEGIYSEYARDVVRPSAQECAQNGRARSTKMRWAVKAE